MALKQQTCCAALYPPRCAVGNATDWTEPNYAPIEYEMPLLDKAPHELPFWADKKTCTSDEVAKRLTYCGGRNGGQETTVDQVCFYDADRKRYCNPKGKTGLRGRGQLGRFGPNHAADCIVTRFHPVTGKPQAVVVDRVDGDKKSSIAWPAGMVEPGEEVPDVLEREFGEEAVVANRASKRLFAECRVGVIYRGWVDDHRNTDEAWMETTVVHFHASEDIAGALDFGTKDTHEVKTSYWVDIDSIREMYASHYDWLCIVRQRLDDETRKKDALAQLNGVDCMADGEKLSAEEIAVAVQWRQFDKDALAKRLRRMLSWAGAAQLQIDAEGDDVAREGAEMAGRGCKRARTTAAS